MAIEDEYIITIGLEVHCELKTNTKLFCGCANQFGSEPNTNICPVCLGLPGSLPVINERAVEYAIRIGSALSCEIRPSVFHRKNYFYPDMPKDYQVSQYDEPICVNGKLELPSFSKTVRIERAHMEEDTGKTTHVGTSGRIHGADFSLVDYNRAGIPLVEIVSAPDLSSADEAREYVSELRAILVSTKASDGKMEEGSLRVDANVSVRPLGTEKLGTRCEIKNLNSLRSLGRAINYEARRQMEALSAGQSIRQETRHWNEDQGVTSALRSKEEAYDYRYFPEPDLTPLDPDMDEVATIARALGILPPARRLRLRELLDGELTRSELEQVQTCVKFDLDEHVLDAVRAGVPARLALARGSNELASYVNQASVDSFEVAEFPRGKFIEVISLESQGKVSSTQAKTLLSRIASNHNEEVSALIEELGYKAASQDEISELLERLISENSMEWERLCAGENQLAGFFIGKAMKITNGKVNGKTLASEMAARRLG